MDTANRATGSVRNQFMYMWKMASPGDANIEFYTASQGTVNYLNILITIIL